MKPEFIAAQVIGVIMETLITYQFFDSMLKGDEKQHKYGKKTLLFFIGMTVFLSITNCCVSNLILTPLCLFLAIFAVSFAYNGEMKNKISLSLLMTLLFILAEMAVGMVNSLVSSKSLDETSDNFLIYFEGLFISQMVAFIFAKLIEIRKNKFNLSLSVTTWLGIMTIPVASIISVISIVEIAYKSADVRSNIYVLILAVCLIIANAFVFQLFEKELKNEGDRLRYGYIEKQLSDEKEHYRMMADAQIQVNKTAHDMKNSLTSILGSLEADNYDEAKNKISSMIDFTKQGSRVYTGQVTIDTMLSMKIKSIELYKIDFNPVFMMQGKKFDDINFCIVLGNALDNAVEACCKLPEDKRYIKLKIVELEDFISCYIENSSNGVKPGSSKTSKADKSHHGFGLDNMNAIIEENGGSIESIFGDNEYKLSVLYKI